MLKPKVNIRKKGIIEIEFVEYSPRKSSTKRKYYETLRKECIRCFKEKLSRIGKFYTGGSTGRHTLVWSKYAPEIIREFKEKYREKYEKGYNAYISNDGKTLKTILIFLREKLEIKFTGEPKKHFEFKLR